MAFGIECFGKHPQLDGEAPGWRWFDEVQRLQGSARREAELDLDEIDAHDFFRHGVFDLESRIGLHEEELVACAQQELEGADARIFGGSGQRDRGFDELFAKRRVERRRGRDLDELLVPPLQGALAIPEMARPPLCIGDDLDFDMSRVFDDPFCEESL